jgi:endonuclease/exonuclease/phosphatase family metal-dependent hydrolase
VELVGSANLLRVATWNCMGGRSLADGSVDPRLLVEAVQALDADVLALQEVDRDQPRSGGVDQTAVAAAALGARAPGTDPVAALGARAPGTDPATADDEAPVAGTVRSRFVPTLLGTPGLERSWRPAGPAGPGNGRGQPAGPGPGREGPAGPGAHDGAAGPAYGVALLTRRPVRRWHVLRFDAAPGRMPLLVPAQPRSRVMWIPDEPRAVVAAELEQPRLTVLCAHLSFVPGANVRQLRALCRWARTLPGPHLLLGDLNLPGPLPAWISGWAALARVPTYPAPRPKVQFDHALGHGIDQADVRGVRTTALPVGDHDALSLDLLPPS